MSSHTYHAELYRKKYEDYISDLQSKIRKLEKEVETLERQARAGKAFENMMKAVKENQTVKGSWDKFMVTLRMTGYDKSE